MNYLVDPADVTKFDRTEAELELFWMFCTVVAGKTARVQARLLEQFLLSLPDGADERPFHRIHACGRHSQAFLDLLTASKLGQYRRLRQCWIDSTSFLYGSLSTCTVQDLEAIHGVGPKTARFFLLHSRPDQKIAVLDTHVLKYLRHVGIDAPLGTPSGTKYAELEQEFLKLAEASGQSVADFDLQIWRNYSGN